MSRSAPRVRGEKSRASLAPVLPPPPSATHHVDSASIVPGQLTKSEWMDMLAQEEGEEVVAEVLDELMCSVMEKCYQVYLQRQVVPFTVSWARQSLVQTLKWHFLVRDEGDEHDCAPFWEQDCEPVVCDIDSWAQGCVPVVYSRPIPKNNLLQRSVQFPVADAANPGSPQAKNASQSERKEDHSDKDPCKEDKNQNCSQGHSGVKPKLLIPCPPSKRGDKKKHALPHCSATQAPQVSHSVSKEERPFPKDQAIYVSKSKHDQKHPDSAVKRLDPARLVRHQVRPGFEVLESSLSHLPIVKSSVPPIPHQKQDKHNSKQPADLKLPNSSQASHMVHRRSTADGALWLSSRKRYIQDVGQPQGSIPISSGILLESMVLSPGVTLKDPRGVRTKTYTTCLPQIGQRESLKPIRSSLPAPLFSKDQLMSG